jgi:hypothetical protein
MLLIYTVRIVHKFCGKFNFKLTILYIGIKGFGGSVLCQPKKRTESFGLKVADVGKF